MSVNPRTGRRPGTTQTREAVLAAARRAFADLGYADTTIRRIAAEAEVDPALVIHYFGSKDALFGAVLGHDPPLGDLLARVVDGDTEQLGRRLVRHILRQWEDPRAGRWLGVVTRAASVSESAAAALSAFMTARVLPVVAERAAADRPELRANLIGSQMFGLGMARYVLRVEPLASLEPETVVDAVGPVIQHYLTGQDLCGG